MSHQSQSFLEKSTAKAADKEHRRKINFNIGKYNSAVPQGKQQFADLNLAREKAKNIKWRAIEKLDRYLEQFESNISKRGAKLIWAENSEQALEAIGNICEAKNCKEKESKV
jgi:L-lactate dehydrogenase complex protein LldF